MRSASGGRSLLRGLTVLNWWAGVCLFNESSVRLSSNSIERCKSEVLGFKGLSGSVCRRGVDLLLSRAASGEITQNELQNKL